MSFGIIAGSVSWSPSEKAFHKLIHVRFTDDENPTHAALTPYAAQSLRTSPLLAIGALDPATQRPWTSVWGGEAGFVAPLGGGMIGVRTPVEGRWDPVVEILGGGQNISRENSESEHGAAWGSKSGEVRREDGNGRVMAGLGINLARRTRVKIAGRAVAGALLEEGEPGQKKADLQLVAQIDQSLGNCPKYLNQWRLTPTNPQPTLMSTSPRLPNEALSIFARADLFFISTANLADHSIKDYDMDTNHRGGPTGFIRVVPPADGEPHEGGTVIVWPEYSGNQLYQTLGNLHSTPRAGIAVPDFLTGDVLYLSGDTQTLVGADAAAIIPKSNLAVRFNVREARFVKKGLSFTGVRADSSPYNPPLRKLKAELKEGSASAAGSEDKGLGVMTLTQATALSPNVARFRFRVDPPSTLPASQPERQIALDCRPGQWIALDFSSELYHGYAHMNDDDPQYLNDDFVRTFTVSSHPGKLSPNEIEITARRTGGPVTAYLFRQISRVPSRGLQMDVRAIGLGGDFFINESSIADQVVPFIAGGVGITPVLSQIGAAVAAAGESGEISGPLARLVLLWSVRVDDLGLVADTFTTYPALASRAKVFLTGGKSGVLSPKVEEEVAALEGKGVSLERRRLTRNDLGTIATMRWFCCAGKGLRNAVVAWVQEGGGEMEVVEESFEF
ncbi:hypothetical protein BDY21DRAFT_150696 [Lineolata rhizophorae]|uniref:FAD-binding FR-type domain-containing protein n=1 Tax=Lineolata rhizophorae TaxID=578093 RepID=A0A6A6NMD9_9PEZI|nr:hypothetical protein BDY21DRAFT_150696 [Lineolata rhizophorae]